MHLREVATLAADLAAPFGCAELASLSGWLHDLGKQSPEFQAYIQGRAKRGGDHSSAGAAVARARKDVVGRLIAPAIAGHHSGLADASDLKCRLGALPVPPAEWKDVLADAPTNVAPTLRFSPGPSWARGFRESLLIRMLFSCLADADFLATEAFYAKVENQPVERDLGLPLVVLRDRLRSFMLARRNTATPLNALRSEVLDFALAQAKRQPGLFTFTAPTGAGKTLASLSFALEHAVGHGLRGIIYVIPYTSIVEQTAAVFRDALGNDAGILEHHSSYDWETALGKVDQDEGREDVDKLKRAAENWDAPIVVTTAVQFFESLFANRTSSCRKLHNIAASVVILDEVQTLPLDLLMPCLAAIDELARNYRVSLALCTATQSALRVQDGALRDSKGVAVGLDIAPECELAPDPPRLYRALRRVNVERLREPADDDRLAARFAERPRMLCIVNSRPHAQALYEIIRDLPGAICLTTLLCSKHRRRVLETARERLRDKQPVRIVSTSLIEAGVDISFPEVWRAATGLDSIAQSAGRCNREGELSEGGRVVVFEPASHKPPHDIAQRWQAAKAILDRHDDPLGLEAVGDYFRELYFVTGGDALLTFDNNEVVGAHGIMPCLAAGEKSFEFPFASIAKAFQMVDDEANATVIVPWDDDGERLMRQISVMDRPRGADLRRLRQYAASIPKRARDAWLTAGVLLPVHAALGEDLLRFVDLAHYDVDKGVCVDRATQRGVQSNII